MEYLNLLGGDFLFSLVIAAVAFILGWVLYSGVVLRNINLRDALFEKDNVAAWIEFIGAFVFPVLFLSSKAIEGAADENLWKDLAICTGFAVLYVIVFTLLRLLSGVIVRAMKQKDEQGSINLNDEVYTQKNASAALFSVSLSIIFISLVMNLNPMHGNIEVSLYKMADVLIFSLVALIVYSLVLNRRTTLFREVFIDNNIAAGAAFAGFVFAIETLLINAISLQVEFNFVDLAVTSLIWLVLFGVLSIVFKACLTRLIKVDIWKEVYEQNSLGAAIGQCALYIGLANVIVNFIK